MGLLGTSWEDPQSQGLLALAAGMMQGNIGKGASDMNTVMAGAQDMAMKRKLLEMQFQEAEQGLAQKKLGMSNMQEGLAMLKPSAPSASMGQLGSGTFGIMSTQGGMPDIPAASPSNSVIASWSPEKVLTYERLTGQKVADVWKSAREGVKRESGSMYEMPDGTRQMGPPSVDKNMQLTPDGMGGFTTAPVAGSVNAVGQFASATEGAKAAFDLVVVPDGKGGMQTMTRAAASRLLSDGGNAMPVMPNRGNSQPTPAQMALIQADIARTGNPNPSLNFNTAQPQAPVAYRPSNSAPANWGASLSTEVKDRQEVDQARSLETARTGAKAGADRIMLGYDNARSAVDSLTSNAEARKSIVGGSFLGAGAATKQSISKALASIGFDIAPDKVTNTDYLQSTLGQGVLNKAKTLGANPTDNDARIIQMIVGSIGTDPNALNKLLDHQDVMAARSIDTHNKNYADAKSRNFDAGFDLTIARPKASSVSAMDTMPKANASNKGRSIRDTETGKVLKSNGLTWVEDK